MKRKVSLKYLVLFWLFLMSQPLFCQLGDFDFSVTTTDETCAGNGSISMTVSGTTPGATLTYTLYLYPDTDTPLAQTTANVFQNLNSGTYLVVATQSLGTEQNTQSQDATILDATTSLNFEIAQAFSGNCVAADLIVNVLEGNAVSYEIISGPVTLPPQTSNIFEDVPEGTYVIRVYDACNNALTKTFVLLLGTHAFELGAATLPSVFDSCDATEITNTLEAETGSTLAYPITLHYTVFPPDGSAPITFSETHTSGPESLLDATTTIALYGDQVFDVQIVAEDTCGNIETITSQIDPNPIVTIIAPPGFCGKDLNIQIMHFMPPFALEFTQAPAGFDPSAFNEDFPGPFSTSDIHFGQEESGVPYGTYGVLVTDACGRTDTHTFEVVEEPIDPVVTPTSNGCDPHFGAVTVMVPDRDIVSAIFTQVPNAYPGTPPIELSDSIENGILTVENLPLGFYLLELIDHCGSEYLVPFSISEASEPAIDLLTTPNCVTETGTLRISSNISGIETVVVTGAPATFPEELPYDYSAQIMPSGIFYVGNLPEGTYTFEITDTCGNEFVIVQAVAAYHSNPAIYDLQRNCGSFNLGIQDTDVSVWDQTYWFQKYFPESDSWGHPYTGESYVEGTMPNSSNAIEIENEETIYNIFLIGSFRLIKAFQPYNNPTPDQRCYDVFATFDVASDLVINGVYNLDCEGAAGASDIFVDVTGVEPYHFSIVSPIPFDNGSNPIFSDISPGTYEIKVEDVCGSIEHVIVNLEDLLPVVNIFTPEDMVLCGDGGNPQAVFDLSLQTPQLLGNQNPDNFSVTYHLSQADADTGNNPLPEAYENSSNPQTVYARVVHNNLNICYATASFQLIVGAAPLLGPDETITVCDGSAVTLSVPPGHDAYLWSTGETSTAITVEASGNYTVTVSDAYGEFLCDATKTFTVFQSGIATIESITLVDWTQHSNSISVSVSGLGDYEFSLDGITYQPDGYFDQLPPGEYTIYVRDIHECGVVTEDVYLLNYMKFFTPNGDGTNEVWQISGAQYEPNLEVLIFDRYGKLLAAFKGDDIGWNGIYNGQNMPSNDYWFVVKRIDGKTYKGHFALKR